MIKLYQIAAILGMSGALYYGLWLIVRPAWRALLATAL